MQFEIHEKQMWTHQPKDVLFKNIKIVLEKNCIFFVLEGQKMQL